jgi:hypothetical protein
MMPRHTAEKTIATKDRKERKDKDMNHRGTEEESGKLNRR